MMSTSPGAAQVFDRLTEIPFLAQLISSLQGLEGEVLEWRAIHVAVGCLARTSQAVTNLLEKKYSVKVTPANAFGSTRTKTVSYFGIKR